MNEDNVIHFPKPPVDKMQAMFGGALAQGGYIKPKSQRLVDDEGVEFTAKPVNGRLFVGTPEDEEKFYDSSDPWSDEFKFSRKVEHDPMDTMLLEAQAAEIQRLNDELALRSDIIGGLNAGLSLTRIHLNDARSLNNTVNKDNEALRSEITKLRMDEAESAHRHDQRIEALADEFDALKAEYTRVATEYNLIKKYAFAENGRSAQSLAEELSDTYADVRLLRNKNCDLAEKLEYFTEKSASDDRLIQHWRETDNY